MFNWIFSNRLKNIDLALLLLRIIAAGAMLTHGYPKFLRILSGNFKFGDPIGLGPELSLILVTFAEFLCSIFLIIGLKTRISAFFLIFTMGVACFVAHGDDPFSKQELPLLYFSIFLTIFLTGGGKYSLEERL